MATGLAALRAAAASAPAPAAASAKKAAAPAAAPPQRDTTAETLQLHLATTCLRLLSIHDRDLNLLLDRSSYTVVIYNEETKKEAETIRDTWRAEDPAKKSRKEAKEAKSVKKKEAAEEEEDEDEDDVVVRPETATPAPTSTSGTAASTPLPTAVPAATHQKHPLGSQRSIMFALMMEKIAEKIPVDREERGLAEKLAKLDAAEIDLNVFRMKPSRADTPRAGKPWVWSILLADGADKDTTRALKKLSQLKADTLQDQIKIFPQNTLEGNLIKSVRSDLAKRKNNSTTAQPSQATADGDAAAASAPAAAGGAASQPATASDAVAAPKTRLRAQTAGDAQPKKKKGRGRGGR